MLNENDIADLVFVVVYEIVSDCIAEELYPVEQVKAHERRAEKYKRLCRAHGLSISEISS
jgi:hypothetical protein